MSTENNHYIEKLPGFTICYVGIRSNVDIYVPGVMYAYECGHCAHIHMVVSTHAGMHVAIDLTKEQAEAFGGSLLEPGTLPKHLKIDPL